jgi:CarD family transcriptional regulator
VFSVGDRVIYGSNLLCIFDGIQDKEFDNKTLRYFVIKPIFEKGSTIYIPFEIDDIDKKIHRLLSVEEINAVLTEDQKEDTIWIENEKEREERFRQILTENDRIIALKLLKTLCLRKALGKKLNVSDERILKDAQKTLFDELAYVLDVKRERILSFILEQTGVSTKSPERSVGVV